MSTDWSLSLFCCRIPQHELEARIEAVDAQLVKDTCYKYIYDRSVTNVKYIQIIVLVCPQMSCRGCCGSH